jgi:GT2 family glycosyltransferase
MNDKPSISICVANYNGADIIESCLDSIYAQTCKVNFEVIIHDDASNDDSANLIAKKYPQAELIRSKENVGYCISNNRMAGIALGEFILLLNNDASLKPHALEHMYQYSSTHPDCGVLTIPQYSAETGKLLDKGMFMDLFSNPIPNTGEGTRGVATVMGSCLWVEKRLWREIGGFPEWFGSIAEDMYLCCYARLLGKRVTALDHSGYTHYVGYSFGGGKAVAKQLKTSYKRRTLSEVNKTRVMILFYPSPIFLLALPTHLSLIFIEGLVLTLLKKSIKPLELIYIPCIRDILIDSKKLYQLRMNIQAKKKISNREFYKHIKFTHHKLKLLIQYGLPKIN